MPMGALNAAPVFACMMEELQNKWKELAKVRKITNADSKVIIDDVILHGETIDELLEFLYVS